MTDHVNGKQSSKKKKKTKKNTTSQERNWQENFLSVLFVNKAVKKTTGPSNIECLDAPSFLRMELWDLGFSEHPDGLQTC